MMSRRAPDPIDVGGSPVWRLGDHLLNLDRPVVVGVLNVTPDSFSDGGLYAKPAASEARALRLIEDGADIIDVGGESSRPGAEKVPADEEWRRVGPVLERLRGSVDRPISIDTTKASVAARALDAGAAAINDISGLRADPRMASLAATTGAGLVLMHMRGDPRTMQSNVVYDDLIGEVHSALAAAVEAAAAAGCELDRLVVDPGIGFGKSADGSLQLLSQLDRFSDLGRPIMVGPSRKSFIGSVLNLSVEDRIEATIAACVMALERGARLFRVHDVREVRRALDLANAIRRFDSPTPVRGPAMRVG